MTKYHCFFDHGKDCPSECKEMNYTLCDLCIEYDKVGAIRDVANEINNLNHRIGNIECGLNKVAKAIQKLPNEADKLLLKYYKPFDIKE